MVEKHFQGTVERDIFEERLRNIFEERLRNMSEGLFKVY